ncbi:hypothetical protein BO79DRAFT_23124 [Aspergillus costaricaensis CBS 115574]|uniref:Uncharacterized protein n=1 Tax=Aspergillus costaricaensis CBS 115574 TaxID=1448317 RepID=A0ACD1ICV7_9EURO|nr:hypothetical protein BO79DRAFT_23124 [Aspergillus costaricaensis CBS 115574]RAK87925.1 hypothetical protein BO79DRAFT_23124 [Aspergillus costaricaensis CBS 115574]
MCPFIRQDRQAGGSSSSCRIPVTPKDTGQLRWQKHIAEAAPADFHPLFNQNSLTMDSRAQLSPMGQGSTTTVGGHATIGSCSADVLAFFLRRIMLLLTVFHHLAVFLCHFILSMALDSASRPSSHPKGRAPFRHISKDYDRVAQSTLCVRFLRGETTALDLAFSGRVHFKLPTSHSL